MRLVPKHCPICGRSSDDVRFFGEFCESCSAKAMLKSVKPEMEITECRRCGRIRIGNGFVEKDRKSLGELLRKNFAGYVVKLLSFNGSSARIALAERVGPLAEIDVKISSEFTTCPTCGRKLAGYYEGVIQFRGRPEKIEKIFERLASHLERNGSFIARVEDSNGGKDVFVGSKTMAASFLKRMHIKYKASYTLYGTKNGKKLYRHTFSVSL